MPTFLLIIRNRFRRWRRTTSQARVDAGRATLSDFPIYPYNPEA